MRLLLLLPAIFLTEAFAAPADATGVGGGPGGQSTPRPSTIVGASLKTSLCPSVQLQRTRGRLADKEG